MDQTNGGDAETYFKNCALRIPKKAFVEVEVQWKEDARGWDVQSQVQLLNQHTSKYLSMYISAQRIGAVEACSSLLEFWHVDIWPKSIYITIRFARQLNILIQNPAVASSPGPRHLPATER